MDNSGRREAPITFFFLIEFCFIQDILPQGSPDRKVNNIRKGFLVIHRLWMSLLVLSSGFFFISTRHISLVNHHFIDETNSVSLWFVPRLYSNILK